MRKKKVLFICVHNSARSVMAEAFVNSMCGGEWEATSAGLSPGTLNSNVQEVMAELGIDVSQHQPRAVFDVFKSGQLFHQVITVCDDVAAERCPIFPGVTERLHWSFPDPSALTGERGQILQDTRDIRDIIAKKVKEWCGNC